ncbi:MAG TPA: CAP domain-containing protein [Prolixibacteraceae bacterium]
MRAFSTHSFAILTGLIFMVIIGYSNKAPGQAFGNQISIKLTDSNLSSEKELMLSLINKYRKEGCKCGRTFMPAVDPLIWNSKLEHAAQKHSKDMFDHKYFAHINKQWIGSGARITKEGYIWSTCGENIAMGQTTVEEVMNGWIMSEGHCKNLMNKSFKEVGSGWTGDIWVQNFGTPR